MNLTDHFSLGELTRSDTATRLSIDQTPSSEIVKVLENTANQMEVVRAILGGKPIVVSSGYRSPALNKAIGGAKSSAHMTGHAVDFTCPEFGTPRDIVKKLSECPMISFDQLISEGDWVHISFAWPRRREVLTAHFGGATTTYTKGVA